MTLILRHNIPSSVFVPFEWTGKEWTKRDDLPRFKEPEEAHEYFTVTNPSCTFRDGKPVMVQWIECREYGAIKEYLLGVGTPEWLSMRQ
jgi:hypothetical protein